MYCIFLASFILSVWIVDGFVPAISRSRMFVRSSPSSSTAPINNGRSFMSSIRYPTGLGADKLSGGLPQSDWDGMRNVAIIAHVDHGKTTLVDSMLRQSGSFRSNQAVGSMDSNAQERERGITILAKNAAIMYNQHKINLVDTPGHADFGGEVERILNMVDGVLLVVDCVDGPKPQTRFVLKKALEKNLTAIVVINKMDRPQARPSFVVDRVFDLFSELNASDEQMDFKVVYASGAKGVAGLEPTSLGNDLTPLFDEILKLPSYSLKPEPSGYEGLQMLVANVAPDEFKGKLGIGRVLRGSLRQPMDVCFGKPGETFKRGKIASLGVFADMGQIGAQRVEAGDIAVVAGIPDVSIGDTIMDVPVSGAAAPVAMPPITIDEPTVRMTIGVNKSPFAGKEGKLLQTRVIRDRLYRELETNVALRVSPTESSDVYEVCGRGQLHLTVLIENMRREGFELYVGPPTVIDKTVTIDGVATDCEPFEQVDVTVPNEYTSAIVDTMNKRRGEMLSMTPLEGSEGFTLLSFIAPTRGLIGLRSSLLTTTKGTALIDTLFHKYLPKVGVMTKREKGSLLAHETGVASAYGIEAAQERGRLFIGPKAEVYENMIIGINQRPGDLAINVCRLKKLTNMRAASAEEFTKISPPMELNLDIAVEYIEEDELIEVTPTQIRMLKNPDKRPRK